MPAAGYICNDCHDLPPQHGAVAGMASAGAKRCRGATAIGTTAGAGAAPPQQPWPAATSEQEKSKTRTASRIEITVEVNRIGGPFKTPANNIKADAQSASRVTCDHTFCPDRQS